MRSKKYTVTVILVAAMVLTACSDTSLNRVFFNMTKRNYNSSDDNRIDREPLEAPSVAEYSDEAITPIPASPLSQPEAESFSKSEPEVETESFPQPEAEAKTELLLKVETESSVKKISPLKFCLMGDIMCLSGQQYSASKGNGKHDYTDNYLLIKPLFDECDYVIANLETCLAPSSPYSIQEKQINANPNCNAPTDLLDSLTQVGITHLVTANNHCLDANRQGILETITALDEAGIAHTGTHVPDYVPPILEKPLKSDLSQTFTLKSDNNDAHFMTFGNEDITVAVISVTELINQRQNVTAEEMCYYVDEYSPAFITEQIALAKEQGADYVVVYEHWGSENTHELKPYQEKHAMVIADAGADLIIGSHSHCIQPFELLTASDGRQVPCYYSLGNLVSSMTREINDDSVLVFVTLEKDSELHASITNRPCHVIHELNGASLVITPTDYETGSSSNDNHLRDAENRILAVLDGTYESLEEYLNQSDTVIIDINNLSIRK